jgi:hypothetical protein
VILFPLLRSAGADLPDQAPSGATEGSQ